MGKTIFFITSDHASYEIKKRLPRIESYYNEALQIPFIIHLPKSFIKNNPYKFNNLTNNQNMIEPDDETIKIFTIYFALHVFTLWV